MSSIASQDAPFQEAIQAPDAQTDQQKKSRKVWGGVDGGAVLPTEQGQHSYSAHCARICLLRHMSQ